MRPLTVFAKPFQEHTPYGMERPVSFYQSSYRRFNERLGVTQLVESNIPQTTSEKVGESLN